MASYQYVYHMQGLSKAYPGGKKVLDNIHLSFYPGAKIGVLGVNGAGKSTLLRIMAGTDKEWTGEAWAADGARVGYLPQEPQLDPTKNVRENVMEGVAAQKAILDRYNELAMNYSDETADEMTKLQDEIEAKGLWDLDSKVDQAMDALRCPPDDWDVSKLSGGEKRRVALCQLLLAQPDLLLLDEPTNHLDAETVNWLEGHLRSYPGAILIVTHDRYFLDNVTGWILELDRGRGIPYEGNYSSWLEQKQKRLQQEGREEEARQRALEAEREWISASPKARQAKSKARIQRYEDLVAKQNDKAPGTAQIIIPVAERLGNNVIEFDSLKKGYGEKLLIDGLSFKLPPGGIVGVIGPNGAGKTTLFRMITGQDKPDEGAITIGDLVKNALRMRPDRIILGEIRGAECFDLLAAMNTGHDGSMCTLHANSPRECLGRMENMILMGDIKIPKEAISKQIADSVDLIVQVKRLRDGSRRVTNVTEVIGMEGDVIVTQELFKFEYHDEDDSGKIVGEYRSMGLRPYTLDKARMFGFDQPFLEACL